MTRWPRTLRGQLAALLVLGLALAWGLSLLAAARQRAHMLDAMVLPHVGRDVASALDLLDQLPAAQRPDWLARLSRPSYRFALQAAEPAPAAPGFEPQLMQAVARQAGAHRVLGPGALPGGERALRLRLRDGTDAALVWRLTGAQAAWQGPALLLAQMTVVALCVGVAARRVTAPLARLAQAAQRLGADPQSPPLPEDGPLEVRQAAAAFNAMQRRIARHLDERLEILAAVSHDLKTPLTRLRMRCELMDGHPQRERLQADLDEMQHLVEEGLAYARSAHAATEPAEPVDLPALLHTLVCDRLDAGQAVHWSAPAGPLTLRTRPQALRRIVGNLLDNALKFAGAAELQLSRQDGALCIDVLDRGPGIPAAELPRMLEPFQRLDASRSRDTGGSGLGLAIAVRLAQALGAELQLGPRPGGGLQARLKLPTP